MFIRFSLDEVDLIWCVVEVLAQLLAPQCEELGKCLIKVSHEHDIIDKRTKFSGPKGTVCVCVCVCVIWPTIHNVPGSLCSSVLSCKCWANVWEARLDELPLMEVSCCSTLNMVTWSKYTNNAWFLPTTALNRMWTNCSHPIFSLFVSIIREWEQNNRHPI